jgi:nucleoid-associated protein YgaU
VAAAPDALGAEPVQEKREAAQAGGPKPDTISSDRSPLSWLRYARERFRTLMQMLAERAAGPEAMRAAEAKRAAQAKAADDAKRAVEETRRAAEVKAAEDARRAAEVKAAEDARRAAEAKAAEDARRAAEAKAAEDARQRAADAGKAAEKAAPAVEPGRRAARAPCENAGVKVAGAGWYVVRRGDSLWRIARVHFGAGKAYRRIYAANRGTVENPRRIYPCQRIYIPAARRSDRPLPGLRVALEPFIRRRAIDTGLPGFIE